MSRVNPQQVLPGILLERGEGDDLASRRAARAPGRPGGRARQHPQRHVWSWPRRRWVSASGCWSSGWPSSRARARARRRCRARAEGRAAGLIFLDASVLLAAEDLDDRNHPAASALLRTGALGARSRRLRADQRRRGALARRRGQPAATRASVGDRRARSARARRPRAWRANRRAGPPARHQRLRRRLRRRRRADRRAARELRRTRPRLPRARQAPVRTA